MMEKMKRYYDGDIKSIIVNVSEFIIYLATVILTYITVVQIIVDVVINHNNLDGRGTFVCQVLLTTKDQLLVWCGTTIKNYIKSIESDLDFRSDARL